MRKSRKANPTDPSLPIIGNETAPPVGEDPVTDSDPEVELGTEASNAEPIGETKPEVSAIEEPAQTPMMTATSTSTTAVVEEAKGTWYYYVQSGDTLQKIATHVQHGCR